MKVSGSRPTGLANFRDIGGIPLANGGQTVRGQVFRSDAPYDRGELPCNVRALTWDTVVDLRSPREFGANLSWEHGGQRHRVTLLDDMDPAVAAGDLTDIYADLARRGGRGLARVVALVAAATGPVLIHCNFGKDRTGVACAVLLLVAGADHEAIVADYVTSGLAARSVYQRLLARGYAPRRPLQDYHFEAPAEAIEAALELILSWDGGVTGYLTQHGATPRAVDAVRHRLTSAGTPQISQQAPPE